MTMPATLKTERERLGLSQEALAAALEIHPMTVSKLERGKLVPKRWYGLALRGLKAETDGPA